mmetsp:Transcript_12566/g.17546  ORF Transcript_12566/g.17546 Transcript_12566/m.17546 type:complete len:124 (-) Transcript_12566:2973-3344(-)
MQKDRTTVTFIKTRQPISPLACRQKPWLHLRPHDTLRMRGHFPQQMLWRQCHGPGQWETVLSFLGVLFCCIAAAIAGVWILADFLAFFLFFLVGKGAARDKDKNLLFLLTQPENFESLFVLAF